MIGFRELLARASIQKDVEADAHEASKPEKGGLAPRKSALRPARLHRS
jgi:hypothetical protein